MRRSPPRLRPRASPSNLRRMSRSLDYLRRSFEPALQGLRLYWPAFVGIQLAAFALTALFFLSPIMRDFCLMLADWKASGGLWFTGLANVVSGGVAPELLKLKFRPPGLPRPTAAELLHQFTMLAVLGVMVDLFYRFQSVLWAGREGWSALAGKIVLDQFGYTLFVALPFIVLWFLWREMDYNLAATWRAATFSRVWGRVGEILISNVFFWVPVLLAVYSLPAALQFLLFLVANAAWCILLIFIARQQVTENIPVAAPVDAD